MEQLVSNYLLVASIVLLLSIFLSKSSKTFGLPILVVFLGIGMLFGSEGFIGINFENYELAYSLSLIAMCVIIFSGGLETSFNEAKSELRSGMLLSSVGIILTTALVGCFIFYVTALSLLESLLLGAILSATDAAAVFNMFKDKRSQVSAPIKNLLKLESGSNDPMAYFLVLTLLGFIKYEGSGYLSTVQFFILNPLVGVVVGFGISKLYIYVNNKINLDYIGLYPALTMAFLFLNFTFTSFLDGNGFIAVYIFGMIVGNNKILHKNLLISFYDGISWLFQIGLFVMLGLLVFPTRLIPIIGIGTLIACFLIFVARPITVYLTLIKSGFNNKEKLFISWAGLKGATPIVFASLAATQLGGRAHTFFDVVFYVVILSALLQGTSFKKLAKKLGLLFEAIEDANFPVDLEVLEKTKSGITEIQIEKGFYIVDKRIVDLVLPKGALILFIKREGAFIIPDGSTTFNAFDKLLLVTNNKEDIQAAREAFEFEPKKNENTELSIEVIQVPKEKDE